MPTDAEIADPFRIGRRTVRAVGPDGRETYRDVPLTEEDFLHPQEEDRFMLNKLHLMLVAYLVHAVEVALRGRDGSSVFFDHRIDWGVPGIAPHGPDIVAFGDFHVEWDPLRGTLPVREVGAVPLVVFEVTSEATRKTDFEEKFLEFFAAGVPVYVIVDAAGPEGGEKILAFRRGRKGFVPIPPRGQRGVLIPGIDVWLRWEGNFVVATQNGRGEDIPTPLRQADMLDEARRRAEVERKLVANERKRAAEAEARAEAERARAEAETARADAEGARADAEGARARAEKQRAEAERSRAELAEARNDALAAELAALRATQARDGE